MSYRIAPASEVTQALLAVVAAAAFCSPTYLEFFFLLFLFISFCLYAYLSLSIYIYIHVLSVFCLIHCLYLFLIHIPGVCGRRCRRAACWAGGIIQGVYMYMYIYIYIYIYVYIYIYIYTHTHNSMCIHIYIYIYIYIHICVCV